MIVCEVLEGLHVLVAALVMGCVGSTRPSKFMDEALKLLHVQELGEVPILCRNGNSPPLEPECMAEARQVTWPKQRQPVGTLNVYQSGNVVSLSPEPFADL